MAKPEREFFPGSEADWIPAQGGLVPGLFERILATDPERGVATRLRHGSWTAADGCLSSEVRYAR